MDYNDVLVNYYGPCFYHHGIKGQKWGVRRSPEELSKGQKQLISNKFLDEEIKLKTQQSKAKNKIDKRAEKDITNYYYKEFKNNWEKKTGKSVVNNLKEFEDVLNKHMEDTFNEKFDVAKKRATSDFIRSNKHAKTLKDMIDIYSMDKWDDLEFDKKYIDEIIEAFKDEE